mgnify:CR=1 FL=1
MRWLSEALRSAALAIRTNFLRSVLTTLGSMVGNWVGGAEIVRSLL